MSICMCYPQKQIMIFATLRCLSHPADQPRRRGRELVKLVIPVEYLFSHSSVLFPLRRPSPQLPSRGGSLQPIILGSLGFSVSLCCQAGKHARRGYIYLKYLCITLSQPVVFLEDFISYGSALLADKTLSLLICLFLLLSVFLRGDC